MTATRHHPKRTGKERQQTVKPAYFVGLGASAGGLEALQSFFSHMPTDSGLAFIVVQHLSPDYKSLMVELLSKTTTIPVLRVEDEVPIAADTIYLIPPKKNMIIQGGRLFLSEQPQRHTLNLPIDLFLQSLAEDQGDKGIGIILSGTGSDGTRGVRALKEQGGTVIAQNPDSAKFDGMPKSAIGTGLADFILTPEAMPEQLIRFISHPCIANGGKASQEYEGEENRFTRLFALLKKKFGTDFTYYKPSTIIRRIERRMGVRQVHTLEDYLTLLRRDDGEMEALYKDLLIGVTKFFRDPKTFAELKQRVIPALFQAARQRDQRSLRVWVAGCSTGEEAYTLAMLLREQQEADNTDVEIKVFATDIDRKAIESAGIGLYPETIVADMEAGYLSRHFDKRTPGYQVKRSIREMVVFAIQDLAKDPPFTKVDLISCRNLLIYLQPVLQRRIMATFNYALQSQGYLLLGSSETVGEMSDMFQPVDAKNRIYRHTGEGHIPLHEDYLLPRPKDAGLPMEYRSLLLAGETGEPRLHDQLVHYYQAIVRKLAEAALVINQERELVQSFGEVKRYLAVPEGPMTLDVLSLLPRELALAASSGIHRARKSEAAVTYRDLRVKRGKGVEIVTLAIDILKDVRKDGRPGPFFLLHLTRTGTAMQTRSEQALPSSDDLLTQRMSDLEQELQFTRENLQATIEELQTSNEELQATNEELLAANEELQSTNEELQSVNEELNTVNTEYQEKNLELAALNTDIRNLMEATDIGTIFLDRKLCIRKFTPAISRTLNLLPQDVGRPLKDLALEGLGDLVQDAAAVVQQGAPVDRLAVTGEGQVLLRVLPFHNADQQIDGAVITVNPCTQHCLSILMPPAEDNGGRAGRSGKDHGSTDRQPDATCGKRL